MQARKFASFEKYLFWLVILISLIPVLAIKFVPTVDGPSHLYNANLLNQLANGNQELSKYLEVNAIPVPNWLFYFVAALLKQFLPAFWIEKILIAAYVIALPLSFRYLVKAYLPSPYPTLVFFVFPLIYSFSFRMGFYNFIFSIAIMFFSIGCWQRWRRQINITRGVTLSALFLLLYFSHLLSFCFAVFIVCISFLCQTIYDRQQRVLVFKSMGKGALIFLPALVTAIIYFSHVHMGQGSAGSIGNYKLLCKLISDKPFTAILLLTVCFILGSRFLSFFSTNSGEKKSAAGFFRPGDFWFLIATTCLILFFVVPDGWNGAMMSDRLLLLTLLMFGVWVGTQQLQTVAFWGVIFALLVIHLVRLNHTFNELKELSCDATEVENFSAYLAPNKNVATWNRSPLWNEAHFTSYLGVNRPLLLWANYEAYRPWFPVQWRYKDIDKSMMSDWQQPDFYRKNPLTNQLQKADYIFIYCYKNDTEELAFQQRLLGPYSLTAQTAKCRLYKLNL